jgi:hypothetical protein
VTSCQQHLLAQRVAILAATPGTCRLQVGPASVLPPGAWSDSRQHVRWRSIAGCCGIWLPVSGYPLCPASCLLCRLGVSRSGTAAGALSSRVTRPGVLPCVAAAALVGLLQSIPYSTKRCAAVAHGVPEEWSKVLTGGPPRSMVLQLIHGVASAVLATLACWAEHSLMRSQHARHFAAGVLL